MSKSSYWAPSPHKRSHRKLFPGAMSVTRNSPGLKASFSLVFLDPLSKKTLPMYLMSRDVWGDVVRVGCVYLCMCMRARLHIPVGVHCRFSIGNRELDVVGGHTFGLLTYVVTWEDV